jgi:hypothetical protein
LECHSTPGQGAEFVVKLPTRPPRWFSSTGGGALCEESAPLLPRLTASNQEYLFPF